MHEPLTWQQPQLAQKLILRWIPGDATIQSPCPRCSPDSANTGTCRGQALLGHSPGLRLTPDHPCHQLYHQLKQQVKVLAMAAAATAEGD